MMDIRKVVEEVQQIDSLVEAGFVIKNVEENYSGSLVRFQKQEQSVILHISTADARKYFVSKIIH